MNVYTKLANDFMLSLVNTNDSIEYGGLLVESVSQLGDTFIIQYVDSDLYYDEEIRASKVTELYQFLDLVSNFE